MYNIINAINRETHVNDIFCIEKACFPGDFWSKEVIKQNIDSANSIQLICYDGNIPVAYADLSFVLDEAELNRICVIEDYRRTGVASFLLDSLKNETQKIGISKIMLEVRSHNLPALFLYLSFGFSIDGIRKKYYNKPDDDAVLMTLHLHL